MTVEVYGLWCAREDRWLANGHAIIWGPNEVIQAQYRRLPPDRRKVVAIRRFNEFGQPADEADA